MDWSELLHFSQNHRYFTRMKTYFGSPRRVYHDAHISSTPFHINTAILKKPLPIPKEKGSPMGRSVPGRKPKVLKRNAHKGAKKEILSCEKRGPGRPRGSKNSKKSD